MRKNLDLWDKWQPGLGLGLHKLQLQILRRGIELLAPGGILVYSTCSLNPVEDEAVVAAGLRGWKGQVELVDASEKFSSLKRAKGLKSWVIQDRHDGTFYSRVEDVPENLRRVYPETV